LRDPDALPTKFRIGRHKTAMADAVLTCLGAWQIIEGGWIHAKAALAGHQVSIPWQAVNRRVPGPEPTPGRSPVCISCH